MKAKQEKDVERQKEQRAKEHERRRQMSIQEVCCQIPSERSLTFLLLRCEKAHGAESKTMFQNKFRRRKRKIWEQRLKVR